MIKSKKDHTKKIQNTTTTTTKIKKITNIINIIKNFLSQLQIPPPSENSEEKQTEMFQFVEKLMVEEIEADLNDHSEWLKIGSVFKIHYLVYHNYVKPGLHISEAIKTAPPLPEF